MLGYGVILGEGHVRFLTPHSLADGHGRMAVLLGLAGAMFDRHLWRQGRHVRELPKPEKIIGTGEASRPRLVRSVREDCPDAHAARQKKEHHAI